MEDFTIINKRGETVPLDFNKILNRLTKIKEIHPKLHVNVGLIAQNTIKMMVTGITTTELDNISVNYCASMVINNPDYSNMASRIEIDNLHRNTSNCYLKYVNELTNYYINGEHVQMLHPKLIKFVNHYYKDIDCNINYDYDYDFDYFGLKTLMKSYLLKHIITNDKGIKIDKIKERPQQLFMRVSIGIHLHKILDNGSVTDITVLDEIFETYKLMSNKYYTHATPTLFNAGTMRQSLSSCFLLSVEDNLQDIFTTLSESAQISKWSGGVGIHVSQVRGRSSVIKSTNGISEGIAPMLKLFNDTAIYIRQGGGKRKGSTAVYLEMWHPDIEEFLDLRKQTGDEQLRARDLFLALWICDLFMERLEKSIREDKEVLWSLFCPSVAKGLADVYGEEYKSLYKKYEDAKLYTKQIPITKLWKHILEIQMESGVPYISFKDHVNRKNNQNNLGTIKSSNLCVDGDTQILTKAGYFKIKDLENQFVYVWNGKTFSKSLIKKTNTDQDLLKITFSNGMYINCTHHHNFYIKPHTTTEWSIHEHNEIKTSANKLKVGDHLIRYNLPIISGNSNNDIKYAYTVGYLYGKHSKTNYISLHYDDNLKKCKNHLEYSLMSLNGNILDLMLSDDFHFKIPFNASIKNRIDFLSGLIDSSINDVGELTIKLPRHKTNYSISNSLMLFCHTLSLQPILYEEDNHFILSFDKLDASVMYFTLKMKTHTVSKNDIDYVHTNSNVSIVSIQELKDKHDTYCFNEPMFHRGILNGVITGNCNEINIYTDRNNIGVCNLASICLSRFVEYKNNKPYYNFDKLHYVSKIAVKNLNNVIDNNHYPVEKGERSDKNNRPIGLGVQSLAKTFFKMKYAFTSEEAKKLNKLIFETIHHAALEASCELAMVEGTYNSYKNSMISYGKLQPDLWNVTPSNLWNWPVLRKNIKTFGIRNSLLMALMPTASSAQIFNNTESVEPLSSNLYKRNVLSGSFQVVNKYLVQDLIKLNLWNDDIKQRIIADNGSIQRLNLPHQLKDIYKTVWEISQKDIINMEADRNAYVCQSTSSNRFVKNPTFDKLTSMHIYTWKKGLKTGMYYLRSQAAVDAVKISIDTKILKESSNDEQEECMSCSA